MNLAKSGQILFIALGTALLVTTFGCTKKQVKTTDSGSLAGSQEAALKGDDLELEDSNLNFVEPSYAEKSIFAEIFFDYDSTQISNAGKPTLENIAHWLKSNSSKHLLIEGHCDERGTKEYNLALGEQRALAVRRYLAGLGIEPKNLHTISYGEERPADPAHKEAAWEKNRRAHFLLSE